MAKQKPKISPRKPPPAKPEDVAAFIEGKETKTSRGLNLQKSRSQNVYLPERKRGWLVGQAPRRCTFYLPQDLFEKLKRHCFDEDVELSAFVSEAVRRALK